MSFYATIGGKSPSKCLFSKEKVDYFEVVEKPTPDARTQLHELFCDEGLSFRKSELRKALNKNFAQSVPERP